MNNLRDMSRTCLFVCWADAAVMAATARLTAGLQPLYASLSQQPSPLLPHRTPSWSNDATGPDGQFVPHTPGQAGCIHVRGGFGEAQEGHAETQTHTPCLCLCRLLSIWRLVPLLSARYRYLRGLGRGSFALLVEAEVGRRIPCPHAEEREERTRAIVSAPHPQQQ